MTIDLPNGRQIVINSDLGTIRLSLWACKGNLGVELSPDDAMEAGWALFIAGRRARKAATQEQA